MLAVSAYTTALAALGLMDGGEMYVPLLPVEPANAATWLAGFGFLGILWSLLAIKKGTFARLPLLAWSALLALALVTALFRSSFRFDGVGGLIDHGWLLLGSIVLTLASWVHMRGKPKD